MESFLYGPEAEEIEQLGAVPLGSCLWFFDGYSYHPETFTPNTSIYGLGSGILQGFGGHISPSLLRNN